jgi:hypothetical protein
MTSQITSLSRSEQAITFIPQPAAKYPKQKILIFDSGTLINLSMNGLLYILEEFKKISDVRFMITEQARLETVDRPSNVPRFELGALRIKQMINEEILEMPSSLNISKESIDTGTKELMEMANHTVEARGKFVNIVSDAEMSCLALSRELSERDIENLIAIDERTTRILAEKPENLQKLMSDRLHFPVRLDKTNFQEFKKFRFIRSTELAYAAHKKGILHLKDPKALEAVLYATKYKGSSVSFDEINVLKKL